MRGASFAFAFALAACSAGADDTDAAVRDLAVRDLAQVFDLTGGLPLTEGACAGLVANDRCYFPPGVDVGFY
jgi:hypothetical protein